MRQMVVLGLLLIGGALVGCDRDEGQRDFAGAATGPAVDVHCAQKMKAALSRFPSGVGDTTVDVQC